MNQARVLSPHITSFPQRNTKGKELKTPYNKNNLLQLFCYLFNNSKI